MRNNFFLAQAQITIWALIAWQKTAFFKGKNTLPMAIVPSGDVFRRFKAFFSFRPLALSTFPLFIHQEFQLPKWENPS